MAAAATMLPEEVPGHDLAATEKYLATMMLEDRHYAKMHQALSSRWDRLHSLSAAMKLMERYGVTLTPQEEERLAAMDEDKQISALVNKMPQQSNEQFQQFFLQLQLLVSTATRVRKALEQGRPDQVDEALTDAESTGISQYILRMAIVQAGSEVQTLKAQYQAYMKEVDARCGKLIRGQEDAMNAQKRLAAAHAQLSLYKTEQNSKVKSVMMNFAATSEKGLVSAVYKAWASHVKQAKLENEVAGEMMEQLARINAKILECREKGLGNARGVLTKKAMQNQEQLRAEIFRCWKDEVKEGKEKESLAGQVRELEQKLITKRKTQVFNTKQMMLRMNDDSEFQLLGMVFAAFVQFHKDYLRDKEMEDKVKESEQKFAAFKAQKSEGAKKVLSSMGGSTDTGLITQTFQAWKELWTDAKTEAELEAKLNAESAKLASFSSKNKDSGMSVMDRARYHLEVGFLLRIFGAWKLHWKMEGVNGLFKAKLDGKGQQLLGVRNMFKRFAHELESSLKGSNDTARDFANGPPPGAGRRLQKSEGTVSLPDINQKQSSSGRVSYASGRYRTPGGSAYPSSRSPMIEGGGHPRY